MLFAVEVLNTGITNSGTVKLFVTLVAISGLASLEGIVASV